MEKRMEIGGRSFRLRYTLNALCAMEDSAGGSLDHILAQQFTAVRLLLWGGLIELQPEMSLNMTGELISRYIADGGTLDEIVNVCADALESAGFFRHGQQ